MPRATLTGTHVYLRELREEFFTQYLAAFSERVKKCLHVSQSSSEIAYLSSRLKRQNKSSGLFFCVFNKKTDKLIGAIEIRAQEETDNQLYSWLNEHYWSKGLYQEALRLASQEYFVRSNHIFFQANVDVSNKRSYYALKKYGFADTGLCNGPYGKQYQLVLRKK